VVSTERRITRRAPAGKEETTVALDYGRVTLGRTTLSLFGTPGQKRFDFMWEILSKEMDGFVMLVDSTETRTFREAKRLIRLFSRYNSVPYVVVANKQDLTGAASPTGIARSQWCPASPLANGRCALRCKLWCNSSPSLEEDV